MINYRGFIIQRHGKKWFVYAVDGDKLSSGLASMDDAKLFIDRHIRRGGT